MIRTFNKKILTFWHSSKHYTKNLGALPLADTLLLASPVLDQVDGSGRNDCTAFMAVEIRGTMKQKTYNTDSQWNLELAFGGNKPAPDGFPLETPFAVGVKSGFVPLGQSQPIDNCSAYFWVHPSGDVDLFDSIRQTIVQNNCPVGVGILWYSDWDFATGGIITENPNSPLGGHALKVAGWKTINGEPYLVLQNSWGTSYGDQGFYYLSRALANKVLNYGVCYWSDNTNIQIQRLGLLQALYANVLLLMQKAFIYSGFSL